MTKQALPAVSAVTKDTIEEFKTADKVVLVAYFAADDKASNETFTEVADGLRDNFLFGATNDAALAKAEGVKQPGLVLYKSFDDGKDVFTETFDAENIKEFAKVASTPLIGEVGPETYSGYMAAGLPLAYIFAETQEERDEFANLLKPLAQKHKGAINFATIDAKSFGQHAGNLNLKAGQWPAFAIQRTAKNEKFPYDQDKKITEKDIGAFVEDFLAGKVDPSVKSEPIPETQGPVTLLSPRTTRSSSSTTTRMFSLSSTPRGAVTARLWLPSTRSSVSFTLLMSSPSSSPSPRLTPPPTTFPMRFRASPPSSSSPLARRTRPLTTPAQGPLRTLFSSSRTTAPTRSPPSTRRLRRRSPRLLRRLPRRLHPLPTRPPSQLLRLLSRLSQAPRRPLSRPSQVPRRPPTLQRTLPQQPLRRHHR
jgi:hypothetical protein